ncbi:hypothetical protein Ocin01_08810 [Orchesella cincta]|uniref:Uncharacterized protein n=1 Tax=Orchesella cincta TaxID=48709 RepID=A0A1D2MY06_ORCCI|nr:hypothetical protein Ocin01_08810 [Orchesella cincta]
MMMMGIQACVLFVLCACCVAILGSSQVFRFCHKGVWHQLTQQDCPYGLLFNEQLLTPCFYTTNSDKENALRIWPTICDSPYAYEFENVTDATSGDGFFLAQKNGEMRMVQFAKDSNETTKPSSSADVISLQSCEDRCYRNIFESPSSSALYTSSSHEESDSLESPHHISRPKLSASDRMVVNDQTLRLGDYLFDQIATPDENPGPSLRVVELFKQSIKIMASSCRHPFISSNFVNRLLYGFLFLISDAGIGELEDVNLEEFEEIMAALNACDEKEPNFRLEGTVKEVIKILENGTEFSAPFQLTQHTADLSQTGGGRGAFEDPDYSDEQIPKRPFPYDELDVFTEAAWSAVQVTHASCFATFKRNANMHHRYVSAMEQLFNGKIQDRWRNPTRLIDDRMWGSWFLADVDITFTNMQACIRAAYLDAPFAMRLDRPIDPVRSPKRKKRSVDDYWEKYNDNGGIRYKLMDDMQCFQNPDDRELVLQVLKNKCNRE